VPEQPAGALPLAQRGEGRRRVGLPPLPRQLLVRVARRPALPRRLPFQRAEGVRQALGVLAVQTGDGAPAGRVAPVVRQEVIAMGAQGRLVISPRLSKPTTPVKSQM